MSYNPDATVPPTPNYSVGATSTPSSLRFVSTRCKLMNSPGSNLRYFNSRSRHIAKSRIVSPQAILSNFYATPGAETGNGAASTLRVQFEQNGNVAEATVSGPVPGNNYLVSNPASSVIIEAGTPFFVRIFGNCPAGVIYLGDGGVYDGECFEYSTSILTDRSGATGKFTSSDNQNIVVPLGIIAKSSASAALLIGDSILQGLYDIIQDANGDNGMVARAIGQNYGYCNLGVGSDTSAAFIAHGTLRASLAQYATVIIGQYGANELGNSLAQMRGDDLALRNLFPTKPFFQCTTTPNTTSTDGWITSQNQTPGPNESTRTQRNDIMRTVPEPWQGCIDIADMIETNSGGIVPIRNGGRWLPGYAARTSPSADGLHPGPTGYLASRAFAPQIRSMFGA